MDFSLPHVAFFATSAGALLLGIVLLALKPPDRAGIRSMLVMLLVFVLVRVLAIAVAGGSARAASAFNGIAAIGVGAVIIRLAGMLLFRVALPALKINLARIVEDLFVSALFAAGLLFWLHVSGVELKNLLATSAVITAVLAFSMQDTLGNVLGGVVLQLDDSVRVGDWVKIDDVSGQVVDVRWRHTAVETRNRETVIIPNGWLVKNRFTIIGSRRDAKLKWRRWVWFNLELNVAPGRVCQVLEDAVKDCEAPNILQDPPPSAVLMDVHDGFGRYALRFWISEARPDDPSDSQVRMLALAALARNGIGLALIQEERLVAKENEARRNAERVERIERGKAALSEVDLFRGLSPEELLSLAEKLTPAPFVRGSIITRQGRVAHYLYVIVSGEADVWAEEAGKRTHIATLKPGQVFGEMGLMTGEPRGATVTAKSEVECYRLGKAGFQSVLRARPEIAGEISRVIAERQTGLNSARAAASADAAAAPQHDAIRSRIRSFFGLDPD